jgi:hypothetical protein
MRYFVQQNPEIFEIIRGSEFYFAMSSINLTQKLVDFLYLNPDELEPLFRFTQKGVRTSDRK